MGVDTTNTKPNAKESTESKFSSTVKNYRNKIIESVPLLFKSSSNGDNRVKVHPADWGRVSKFCEEQMKSYSGVEHYLESDRFLIEGSRLSEDEYREVPELIPSDE